MNTYNIYIQGADAVQRTIKVKATGYTVSGKGDVVTFEDDGKQIAVFNVGQLVGFVRADHVVN